MPPDRLFEDRHRDDDRYLQPGETSIDLLDRTSRPELAWPRSYLNDWFENWPADGRNELRSRLRAKDQANVVGAFWELYLHEAHRRLGFAIVREPELTGRANPPDFLMEKDDVSFYLEATVFGPSDAAVARQKREDLVTQAVQAAYHPDFLIRLKAVIPGTSQASSAAITEAVERWLATLDWESEYARYLAGDHRDKPTRIEAAGTQLLVLPWPRDPTIRGDDTYPMVITFPGGGGVVNEAPALLDDLKGKARQFGKLDRPYVVAVLVTRPLAFPHDVPAALFGPEVVRIPVGPGGPVGDATLARDPRAFWVWGNEQRGTRVSAVLAAFHVHPWRVTEAELRLWRSPWPSYPLADCLPWLTVDVDPDSGALIEHPATASLADLFGVAPPEL